MTTSYYNHHIAYALNRYLTFLIAAFTASELQAFSLAPRLVVNITIDQLRTDLMETFSPLYGQGGFNLLTNSGTLYESASYPFTPVDRASAVACISTGSTPSFNGISANYHLSKLTLRPEFCVDDKKHYASPAQLLVSTIGDEMKIHTNKAAIVWSVAATRESAILSAGHAADGAIWLDEPSHNWRGSTYYHATTPTWFKGLGKSLNQGNNADRGENESIADAALAVINATAMGRDEHTDLLSVTFSAASPAIPKDAKWQQTMEQVYVRLDHTLAKFVGTIQQELGRDKVLFVITSTGYAEEQQVDLSAFKIPTGTFYINRTANLLNMYLSAIYGNGKYVEASYRNEMYINHKLVADKKISMSELFAYCNDFLLQSEGVSDVFTSERILSENSTARKTRNGYHPSVSGDIQIIVSPGWELVNEQTQEHIYSRASFVPFPIIFYGSGIKPQRISTPVTVDRIAPTLAKAIHIRAPNACQAEPLF